MANQKIIKQWFVYAGRDLRAAKALRDLGSDQSGAVTFHCQQCVEKAVKGYLVFHGVRPPKIHVIGDLADLVQKIDPAIGKKVRKAKRLTDYAVAFRYPEAERRPLTIRDADSALKLAQKIYDLLAAVVL